MKPGKVQEGKDSQTVNTSAASAPYSLPGMSGGRSISKGKENNMETKIAVPISQLCPNRINAAHFPVTAEIGSDHYAFCDNCHARLNFDEAKAAITAHYQAR
jgi:hypothetical protein